MVHMAQDRWPAVHYGRAEPEGVIGLRMTRGFMVRAAISSVVLSFVLGAIGAAVAAAAVPTVTASLVQRIDTSSFSPASPDPSGVVYLPGRDRLEISDSEVDETTGAGYHGVNLWQITRSGNVTDTGTTMGYPSREPTGLGFAPASDKLFVSDDTKRRIYVVRPGTDGRFGTADDVVSFIDAGAYGSTDTEDPEFDPATGHLFFLDGVGTEVYDIDPVNGVFGDGDDSMTHFDIGKLGPTDWEGLSSDPSQGTLLVGARKDKKIYEITKTGTLVRIIDASGISGMRWLSGLALAPASDDPTRMDYWIVDRGVDNGSNPSENDGKLFELTIGEGGGGGGGGSVLGISGFSPTSGPTGTSVTITGSAFQDVTVVKFNKSKAVFTIVSDTEITATVPGGATTGLVKVKTPTDIAKSSEPFTVTSGGSTTGLSISGFSPTSGPVGTSVTITGSGFLDVTIVKFDTTKASFTIDSDTQITTTVPAGATTGKIKVKTPSNIARSSTLFTVL
jgi:hypothetical protein